MTMHTPGPWGVTITGPGLLGIEGDDGALVAGVHGGNDANARLIAAAPDLLAALEAATYALQGVQEFLGGYELPSRDAAVAVGDAIDAIGPARAAIAKATGKGARNA